MSNGALEIKAISGHSGRATGSGVSRDYDVCKLVDTTTCIGCKACEVACVEWNGYEFHETTFDNTYQTMPETAWNFWNLIKFNEYMKDDGTPEWLMRKVATRPEEKAVPSLAFERARAPPEKRKQGTVSDGGNASMGGVAGGPGFEPGLSDPKSDGLPLADPPADHRPW